MTDIGAVTPSIEADDAALGMLAELTHELRSAPSLSRRFGEQDDGAVQADWSARRHRGASDLKVVPCLM